MRRFGCDVGNEVVRVLWIVSRSSNSSLFKSLEFSTSIYISHEARINIYIN